MRIACAGMSGGLLQPIKALLAGNFGDGRINVFETYTPWMHPTAGDGTPAG